MRFTFAFLLLIEGALLNGCTAAPLIVLGDSSLVPPSDCSMNVANISQKEIQLKQVLCHLEELVDSLQEPLIQNGDSTDPEVCSPIILQ